VETTFMMIKPDAVAAGHVGHILSAVESAGLEIAGIASRRMTEAEARTFYVAHVGKPFFEPLVEFITSGMTVGIMLTSPDAVAELRRLVGSTDPAEAAPNTIRALYGTNVRENAVHASDSKESVAAEAAVYFNDCPRAIP
jgi:nucleoside-diphosphate kinase